MGMIQNINISDRLTDCLDNDWIDLVDHLDGITNALMDIPEAGSTMRTALIEWCAEVDTRTAELTRDITQTDDEGSEHHQTEWGVQGGSYPVREPRPPPKYGQLLKGCDDKFGCES